MTRPRKQTVDYFPHYCVHKNTMFILEQKYGNDGYAFWFKLLELLGSTDGHFLDLNDEMVFEFLQAKTRLSSVGCTEILNTLCRMKAIDPELWSKRVIWCQNFIENISDVYKNRRVQTPSKPSILQFLQEEKQLLPVETQPEPDSSLLDTDRNPQSRVEESKEKNRDTSVSLSGKPDAEQKPPLNSENIQDSKSEVLDVADPGKGNLPKKKTFIPYASIINHLNSMTGKKYRSESKDTRKFIKARWNQGFILQDFITVINKKSAKWRGDPKMDDFLRPETLFGTKFETYLNESKDAARIVSECTSRNITTIQSWLNGSEQLEKQEDVCEVHDVTG